MDDIREIEVMLGDALRQIRIRRGIPLEELAAKVNLTPATVRSLEKGRGSSLTTLIKVLDELGQLSWIDSLAAASRSFSPIAAMQGAARQNTAPQRVSRRLRNQMTNQESSREPKGA